MAGQQENLAAVLHKKDDIRIEKRPIPEPGENEVLLRMSCVGICGSDVHYVQHGRIGDYVVKKPIVLGHEGAGVVIKLGPGVKNLKVGDRVAVEPSIPCRRCYYCKHGRYNLCTDMSYCATPPDDGNLIYYYKHPSDFCHRLPDNVSLEEGALVQPLSVGVQACRRAGVTLGSTVLITGTGPIGLVTLIAAKAMGAAKVLMTDVVAHRLEIAKTFGADYTLQVFPGESVVQQSAKICSLLTKAPDITIDCCGIESTVRLGLEATCTGGKLVIVGLGGSSMKLELGRGIFREVDVCGVFRFCNVYPASLALVASQKINVKALITHNFHLKDTIKAFQTAISGDGNPIKIMIHCN
ncbi:sorbitol dehydrogenase-like [Schistocerca gregaria]|uniref:sorbitol dehydrogenase-like n=1 Tax=Schistocerca gregaria TaxID=7010 RepID=UPI00211F13A9|nr:sorbitol dehydrogenase-like [Schistocerca gregaria]